MDRKSKRMQSILKLAQHDEQTAIEALGESSRNVESNISQMAALKRYRAEYREQRLQQGKNGFSAAKLQQFQQFLYKLDEIITQQQAQVVTSEQIKAQRLETWLGRRTRTHALDKVTQRYQASEMQKELRQEQKDSDEMAQRRR